MNLLKQTNFKFFELPVYYHNKMECVHSFRTDRERDEYIKNHPLAEGFSYEKDFKK
jgi:hypothetical protein